MLYTTVANTVGRFSLDYTIFMNFASLVKFMITIFLQNFVFNIRIDLVIDSARESRNLGLQNL